MDVEFPDRDAPKGSYFDVIFTIIAVLASGFSGYTTYLGFSYDLPDLLCIPIALIIFFGLVALNFKIREARLTEAGLGRALLVFLLIFVFSFISNTNAIYTFFLQKDIVGQTQEEAWRVYDRETTKVLGALYDHRVFEDAAQRMDAIEIERKNLRTQITDPRNPGLGPKAREHLAEIEKQLGFPLTRLRPPAPDASMAAHEAYAARLDTLIGEQSAETFQRGRLRDLFEFRDAIQESRAGYERLVRDKDYKKSHTDQMRRDLENINVRANRLLSSDIQLDVINNAADETGSFNYTWNNFMHLVSPAAMVISILLGALLDILAPAMSIALYRPLVY